MAKHKFIFTAVIVFFLCCILKLGAKTSNNFEQLLQGSSIEEPSWWQTENNIKKLLFWEKADIFQTSKGLIASEPKTPNEAMFKINIMMRTGMDKEAIETIKVLKEICPALSNSKISHIYYDACDKSAWEIAQNIVEIFADNISDIALDNRLITHLADSGWSIEDIDKWLAQKPEGKNNFWLKERLLFSYKHGKADKLVNELTQNVKSHPENISEGIAYLDVLCYTRHLRKNPVDLTWLGDLYKPDKAGHCTDLADRLKELADYSDAAEFYNLAIDIPVTDEDLYHKGVPQIALPKESEVALFEITTKESLADCLLKLGRKNEAQKLVEETIQLRKKFNLGENMFFAGSVQAASGARTIEEQIIKEEIDSNDNSEYWLDRATYYRGRNNPADEEEAYKKALSLAKPLPEPCGKSRSNTRDRVILAYTQFLTKQKRLNEAVSLLKEELQEAPQESSSVKLALNKIAFDFSEMIDPNDEIYWSWLENHTKWDNIEERLLWRILEKAKKEDLNHYFERAENLAKENASLSKTLGWIMNRMDFAQRSIPLLEYAVAHADDSDLRESAAFDLFGSYLDCKDWKNAKQIFPQAAARLTLSEIPDWMSRIALIALQKDAKDDALRIWKAASNIYPRKLYYIKEFADAGLKNELKKYYQDIQTELPGSDLPKRAFSIIGIN